MPISYVPPLPAKGSGRHCSQFVNRNGAYVPGVTAGRRRNRRVAPPDWAR